MSKLSVGLPRYRRMVLMCACLASTAAAVLLTQSCWTPPFDHALALSLRFEKKLEKVLSIGPLPYSGTKPDTESYFVTTYEARPSDGYWVKKPEPQRLEVQYVGPVSAELRLGPLYISEPNNWGGLNAVQGLSPTVAGSTADISQAEGRGLIIFGSGTVTNTTPSPVIRAVGLSEGLTGWSSPDGVMTLVDSNLVAILINSNLDAIGGSMFCVDDEFDTNSYRNMLLAGDVNGTYTLVVNSDNSLDHTFGDYFEVTLYNTLLNYPVSYPPLSPGALYYSDETYHYVIGRAKDSGEVVACRWHTDQIMNPPEVLDFDCQITDVLHDYRLLARKELTTRYYDSTGDFLFSLPTGSLRYIFELYDNGRYYSYFSRVVCIPDSESEWQGRVRFDVFRYPTEELEDLAE